MRSCCSNTCYNNTFAQVHQFNSLSLANIIAARGFCVNEKQSQQCNYFSKSCYHLRYWQYLVVIVPSSHSSVPSRHSIIHEQDMETALSPALQEDSSTSHCVVSIHLHSDHCYLPDFHGANACGTGLLSRSPAAIAAIPFMCMSLKCMLPICSTSVLPAVML